MPDLEESLLRRWDVMRVWLSEPQRRLWLGVEASELGVGGVAVVAKAAGVSPNTVRRGRREALEGVSPGSERVRAPGAGRKRAEVHDETLFTDFDRLIDPVTRGDPESPLRWTSKSIRRLTFELREAGHEVSTMVVRRLLAENGYSLQANAKTTEGRQSPDRDAQFAYLAAQAGEHQQAGQPVISVDTKKKELVGDFKNNGREWQPIGEPTPVRVHDFKDPELGKVNPYGVYDVTENTGWVSVGTDHDTAAFAVNTIRSWWQAVGSCSYPEATRLLITADGGGSNGYRTRLWKTELARFAKETGLTITVCHLPPGTSKWNKIEHRLFSHISMNWRGRPLTSHEVIVNTIAATTTTTGLTVHAELDPAPYPAGIKITDQQMRHLETSGILTRHDWHPEWNYALHPTTRPTQNRLINHSP